jgi:mono/diheme cytochrome c family protein
MAAFPIDGAGTMRMRTLIAITLAALLPASGAAADADRGRELYESACIGCHGRSVHARTQKSVRSCAELRGAVARFARIQGRNWDAEDLDDVGAWLNLRYYGFPADEGRCLAAIAARGALRASVR